MRIKDLQYSYTDGNTRTQTLFDINLEISKGEVVFIVGPSGCGKTTLLTLIGTLRSVQEEGGTLEVLGHPLHELRKITPSRVVQIRRELGFIFQAHNLFDSLTVEQNVRMATELVSLNRREEKSRINELLTRLGLRGTRPDASAAESDAPDEEPDAPAAESDAPAAESDAPDEEPDAPSEASDKSSEASDKSGDLPGNLSGGQKQRVAVARGMAHNPELILADEPTAALDHESKENVLELFKERAQEQSCTVLVVTHDRALDKFADRIIELDHGRVKSNVLKAIAKEICELLEEYPKFKELSTEQKAELTCRMAFEKHPVGATVFREGDPGDKLYVIRSGTVKVVQEGQVEPIAELGVGKIFGEMALVDNKPRNATVIATEELEVYSLDNEYFQRIRKTIPSFEEVLCRVARGRY